MIDRIITHHRPHLDEVVAIWLLKRYGVEHFPGVGKAAIVYTDAGSETFEGKTTEELEAEGTLMLGVGTGRFNEHRTSLTPRKEGDCVTTLIAKTLGLTERLDLDGIIEFTRKNDVSGGNNHPFALAQQIKDFQAYSQHSDEFIMGWAMAYLDVKRRADEEYWTVAAEQFKQSARIVGLARSRRQVKIAVIVGESEALPKYARKAKDCSVAIIQFPTGHIRVFANPRHNLEMKWVAAEIRQAEALRLGTRVIEDELFEEKTVSWAKPWCFFTESGSVFNGSLTAKKTPPTLLTLDEVTEAVQRGLSTFFNPPQERLSVTLGERLALAR